MLKMTIDGEEVVSKNNFTIKEEMLSPSSTILNNTYPKTWEDDKDYTSRFYYPKDYAKLDIQNFSITPEEAGTTIDIVGSTTLTDVDTTKESRVLSLKGQTSQTGTPTPSSPIPINVVSGDNEINICGKNLADITYGYVPSISNGNLVSSQYGCTSQLIRVDTSKNYIGTYTGTASLYLLAYDENDGYLGYVNGSYFSTLKNNYPTLKKVRVRVDGSASNPTPQVQFEVGSTATTYEPYIGNSYNIDLRTSKNLFNKNTIINDKVLASNGAISDASGYILGDYIQVKPSTQYTISFTTSYTELLRIGYYKSDKTFIERPTSADNPWTITTPNNCYYIRICTPTIYTNVQCEKGSQQTTYEEYSDIELCKIGTYQDKIYKGEGYNLFDKDTWESGGIGDSGETIANVNLATFDYISVKPNGAYTISFGSSITNYRYMYYDANKGFLSRSATQTTGTTLTIPSNVYYLRIYVNIDNATITQAKIDKVQIEVNEGTTALPYEPYNSKDKWLLHKEIGKVVLDGTETGWGMSAWGTSSYKRMSRDLADIKQVPDSEFTQIYSNEFRAGKYNDGSLNTITSRGSIHQLNLWQDVATTNLNAWLTWLASNNLIVYYQLATPTTTEITDTTLLEQLDNLESQ